MEVKGAIFALEHLRRLGATGIAPFSGPCLSSHTGYTYDGQIREVYTQAEITAELAPMLAPERGARAVLDRMHSGTG